MTTVKPRPVRYTVQIDNADGTSERFTTDGDTAYAILSGELASPTPGVETLRITSLANG